MTPLDARAARRIITHLKAGTTPIDSVEHVNVGHERWYAAAAAQLDEVSADGDALVRFVDGYYGDGKTHFLGMLRSIAFGKNWVVSYVSAETTPLHKFDIVYSQIVKNLVLPPSWLLPTWIKNPEARGAAALLGSVFAKLYFEAYRSLDRSGLNKERVLEAVRAKSLELAAHPHLVEAVGRALRAYVEAAIRGDVSTQHLVCAWLEGENVRSAECGLTRRIDQAASRDVMRSISVLARRGGAGGVLILLDEAERILAQSRTVRNRSYGVIRDLLDNADDQGGMQASIIYIAATPEMFQSAKGFPEYDALRSRLAQVSRFAVPHIVDWRGIVVDLTKTTLPHDVLIQLVNRVIDLHCVAYGWDPRVYLTRHVIARMVANVEGGAFVVSKPRLLASYTATLLDVLEQNRDAPIEQVVTAALSVAESALGPQSATSSWE